MFLESDTTINYNIYENRLLSFQNWNGLVSAKELAKAGFYYKNYLDVCCAFCKLEIYKWRSNDNPIDEHFKYHKKCKFVKILKINQTKNILGFKNIVCFLIGLSFTSIIFLYKCNNLK